MKCGLKRFRPALARQPRELGAGTRMEVSASRSYLLTPRELSLIFAFAEFQHPRRGSTPSYWELLSTVPIESGRLISRDPPARESPSASFRRNTTQLPINRYKPRPIGLDGADDEDEEPPQDFYNQIAEHPEDLAELLAEDPWLDGSFARDDNPRRHTPQEASHMPSSTSINRQAPNPSGSQQGQQGSQSQQQQTVNGLGGTHPGGLPSSVPHAGHQTDINYLWGVVQELSDILSQNRAQQANMISNIEQLHIRQREDEGGNEAEQPADGESSGKLALEIPHTVSAGLSDDLTFGDSESSKSSKSVYRGCGPAVSGAFLTDSTFIRPE